MKKTYLEIAKNELKKSLPDLAYNSEEDTFFVSWAAAPSEVSEKFEYLIAGQTVSAEGELLGDPVEIVKTENILMLPHILYNPNKNQYLLIYVMGEDYFNLWGIILDTDGRALGNHFRVTKAPANQFHYNIAFNPRGSQFFIAYNDNRNGVNDIFGIILDETGSVVKKEFLISEAPGHQINPIVCYNPYDDTYLLNWEDFRAHGDSLPPLGTLEVMTDIYGALLSAEGKVLRNNIPMCADASERNADQRFNDIVYNSKTHQFLVSWTDTRESLHNVGIMGRIVEADGSMPGEDFPLVDAPGAQMISHTLYLPDEDKYFIAFERDFKEVDKFYFKDINAHLSIGARWLDAKAQPEGEIMDIFKDKTNQRFVRLASSPKSKTFLLVWQSDFPGVSDSVEGHIMSAGGDIKGMIYKYKK